MQRRPSLSAVTSALVTLAALAACDASPEHADSPWDWGLPPGFPSPRVPIDNPMGVEKVELGRWLFHDRRLSGNGTMSCASCHVQSRAFSEARATSVGSTGEVHPRNAMSLANVAYNTTQTWANPLLVDLEAQALIPMFGTEPVELGLGDGRDALLARLAADPDYPQRFARAFGDASITLERIVKAIATFERALVSVDSPYDRFFYRGDVSAMSEAALRGLDLFFSERLECFHCHGGFNFNASSVHATSGFTETPFFNNGLYNLGGTGAYPEGNRGLFEVTLRPEDMGRFKPPTLRNVTLTAPYMHDGSLPTLEAVIDHYAAGGRLIEDGPLAGDGRANPHKSSFVRGFSLTPDERSDLLAFLGSLTDATFVTDPRFSDPFAK
jgi:cytochrome c peroxidase